MKKFSSILARTTYFVIDSDVLLKSAPPMEQTHYFQTGKIHQYSKIKQMNDYSSKKCDQRKINFNTNKNNQTQYNSPNNKKDIYVQKNDNYYYYYPDEMTEEQLDEEIKATKKRLKELYSQKNQRMIEKHRKSIENKEKSHKLNEKAQYFNYDQFYYPEYSYYYYQNSNEKENKISDDNEFQIWPHVQQKQKKTKEKVKNHHHRSWHDYY